MSNKDKLKVNINNAVQAGKDAVTKTLENKFNVLDTAKELNEKYGKNK